MNTQLAEDILAKLTVDTASQWQIVGEVLRDLEQISGVSPSGETWQEAVAERMAALGHPVSQGHLYKVRRSFVFAASALQFLKLPEKILARAKISAVDVAERLSRLDYEAGYSAVKACVDEQSPATASEIKKMYEDFLESHPERRNPKQLAWVERKKPALQDAKRATDDGSAWEHKEVAVGNVVGGDQADPEFSIEPWLDVLQPVIMRLHDLKSDLFSREEQIKLLKEENEELRREIQEARQHEQLAGEALRDARAELMRARQ